MRHSSEHTNLSADSLGTEANIRVCIVVLELSVGGLERAVVNLANGLQARGALIRIIILEKDEFNTLLSDVNEGVDVFCLEGSLVSKLWQFRQLTRGYIVHLQLWGGRVKPLYRLALLGQGPILSTYSNVYTHMRTHFWTFMDYIMSWQLRGVIAKSNAVKDYCVKTVGIPASKVYVIHNGVEMPPPLPRLEWAGRTLRIISVARLVRQKNHQTLFCGIALASRAGCDLHLTLVGDGPEIYVLVRLASNLGIRDMITWMGEIGAKGQVRALLRQSDVFVTSSLWEGFPNAVLEAMSEGMPIIASDIQPHREALADCAIYFPSDDAEALANALAMLYHDCPSGHRMGEKARQRVSLFSIDNTVNNHVRLYKSIE